MNTSENDPLRKWLGQWKVAEPLPPRFQERVWRRIERMETPGTAGAWELWQRWLEGLFARKAVALAYVSALFLAGVMAGYANGEARAHRVQAELAARYVQSLDPYQKTHP